MSIVFREAFLIHKSQILITNMTVTTDETPSSVGTLEDNAAKRKERLAAMKRKLGGQKKDGEEEGDQEDKSLPAPIFRSYKPLAPELQDNAMDTADPELIEDKIQVNFP